MSEKIACPHCNARYAWKPQLEGKKVRCKCGQTFVAQPPAAVPAAVPADDIMALADEEPVAVAPAPRPLPSRAPAVAAAATRTAPAAATAPAGRSVPSPLDDAAGRYPTRFARPVQEEDDSGAQKKKLIVAAVLLVVVVAGAIVATVMLQQRDPSMVPLAGQDEEVIQLIDDFGATEIREWLSDNRNNRKMVMGMTDQQALNTADNLYRMGAKRVLAFGQVLTKSLAIELPDDPAQRQALIDWDNKWHGRELKPLTDVGQRYLLVRLRL